MADEKRRVEFNAPASLVERADHVSDLLGVSRTRILVEALETRLDEVTAGEAFRERVRAVYYEERIDRETLVSLLGHEEAARVHQLRATLARDPPVPAGEPDLPPADSFYDGPVPEWTPDDETDQDENEEPESADVRT
jgi:hypothetical protein